MNKTKTTGVLFTVGIFAGSFMLFLIQPMVGKILLPLLGGAPAVWTTCMLFFQAALLARVTSMPIKVSRCSAATGSRFYI